MPGAVLLWDTDYEQKENFQREKTQELFSFLVLGHTSQEQSALLYVLSFEYQARPSYLKIKAHFIPKTHTHFSLNKTR